MKTIKFYGFRKSVMLKMQLFDESGKLSSLSGLTEVNHTNTKKNDRIQYCSRTGM
ncbi:hypothetical protein [Chryseobacterium shandongense]|uniref:hypothetical protein n=1 Tax=Chryseobacterium shandongense TaxID=1493872 RepID=UPI0013DE6C63|nr:hypothetical protein [Chryseobacterium shandongense]